MTILQGMMLVLLAGLLGMLVRDVARHETIDREAREHLLRRLWRETRED